MEKERSDHLIEPLLPLRGAAVVLVKPDAAPVPLRSRLIGSLDAVDEQDDCSGVVRRGRASKDRLFL